MDCVWFKEKGVGDANIPVSGLVARFDAVDKRSEI